jgi:hypothetical protein
VAGLRAPRGIALGVALILAVSGCAAEVRVLPAAAPSASPTADEASSFAGQPLAVAAGGAGVWGLTCDRRCGNDGRDAEGSVIRFDPESGESMFSTTVDRPSGIAVGADAVWVVSFWAGTVSRIDPDSGSVTNATALTLPYEFAQGDRMFLPTDIVATEDNVWVVSGGRGELARIDPASGQVERYVSMAPKSIEAGPSPSGARMWFSQSVGGLVARDIATGEMAEELPPIERGDMRLGIAALAAGPDTVLASGTWAYPGVDAPGHRSWTLSEERGLWLTEIHSGSGHRVDGAAGALLGYESGRFWMVDRTALRGLDPHTGEVVTEIELGEHGWVTVGLGAAWVFTDHGRVRRVPLDA